MNEKKEGVYLVFGESPNPYSEFVSDKYIYRAGIIPIYRHYPRPAQRAR